MSFLRLKIATKLPIIMVGLAVLAIVATGLIAAMESEGALEHSAKEEMRAVAAGRHHELHTYLRSMKNEAKILSDNETVIDALTAFEKGWAAIAGDPTKSLQKTYIQDNPHPKGQKDKLVDPGTGSEYARAHKKYHKWFRELQETRGYYDVFLVNHKGQVVYSVFKEKDFATNVETGRYADSGLGRVTQRLEKNFTDGNIVFEDFAPYAPSGGKPAGFIAAPIFDKANEKHGFLVFQMPIDRITAATEQEVGMGDTGEAFLVGQDHLMRTDSRFDEESSVLRVEVRSEAVTRALNGEKGVFVGPNYEGDRAIIAYRPQEFLGTTWALLAQKNMAEVDEPVAALERDILIAGIIIAVVIAAIGIGIGVDYAIHIGERFVEERDGGREPIAALTRTVQGTGGALLASAATTAAGFGVLALALVPSLQRFGFITAVAISYAFLASVLVLPSLLTVWERLGGDTTA